MFKGSRDDGVRTVFFARPVLAIVAVIAVVAVPHVSAGEMSSEGIHLGTLTQTDPLFWDGEYVEFSRANLLVNAYFVERAVSPGAPAASDPCKIKTSPCWRYTFDITQPADELRVSLDSASKDDCFTFELNDPTGRQRGFPVGCPIARVGVGVTVPPPGVPSPVPPVTFGVGNVHSPELFNIEAIVKNPMPGRWEVKVIPADVTDWAFRMRAGLGGVTDEPELLMPNFTPWLPSQFGFAAPVNPRSGTSRENINPPGRQPVSCSWEETVDNEDLHCLRFSSGVHNVGDGPFLLKFAENDQAFQHTYYSDDTPGEYRDNEQSGNYLETAGGSGEYHSSHGHRHVQDMVLYELFQVTNPTPAPPYDPSGKRLIPVGVGEKHGFCTFENQLGNWHSFNQDRHGTIARVGAGCGTAMSLDKGWGDLYPWYVPGQYVDYAPVAESDGSMRAGFYLVRVTIDPDDNLLESNEDDNVGWALIRVMEGDLPANDRVVICDRGWGPSPWHPHSHSKVEPFWWTIQQASQAPSQNEC